MATNQTMPAPTCPICHSAVTLAKRPRFMSGKKMRLARCQAEGCIWLGYLEIKCGSWITINFTNEDCVSRAEGVPAQFHSKDGVISISYKDQDYAFERHDVRQVWINDEPAFFDQALDLILPVENRTKDDWDWIPHQHQYIENIRHRDLGTEYSFFCTICHRNVGDNKRPADGIVVKTDEHTGGTIYDHDIPFPPDTPTFLAKPQPTLIEQAAKIMVHRIMAFAKDESLTCNLCGQPATATVVSQTNKVRPCCDSCKAFYEAWKAEAPQREAAMKQHDLSQAKADYNFYFRDHESHTPGGLF
jgi:hypothetical protein